MSRPRVTNPSLWPNFEVGDTAGGVVAEGQGSKGRFILSLKNRFSGRFTAARVLIKRVRGKIRPNRVKNPITVTNTMPAEEILAQFVINGCKDLTRHLETCQITQYPVSDGGFGDIYQGIMADGQQISLKCLRLRVGASDDDKKHLRRAAQELHVWSKCEHPHILQLLGVANHHGRIAMVSPWMDNGDLRWFLSQRPKCIQIAEAVVYLHSKDIVHGDIKGANILISQDYATKLTDFGSATIKASSLQLAGNASTTGPAISIRWAAPELIQGAKKCTTEGDIYALGMTVLEVITGSVPYAGLRDIAVLNKIINKDIPERPIEYIPLGHQHTDLLWSLLTDCWEYEPDNRPTAPRVYDELRHVAEAESINPAIHDAPGSLGLLGRNKTISTTRNQPPINSLASPDQINRLTPLGEILQHLIKHGCKDLTLLLDSSQSSELPLSSGSFRDVYRGILQDGTQIRLESLRFQAGIVGDGRKLLKHTAHEIYVWSKCRHAHVLPLLGVAQYHERLTMVSPWVEHNDLILFLSQQRYPQINRLRLCIQLAEAVAYLHSEGMVHGDIKASNVMLSQDMTIKLAGFGNMALGDYSLAFTPTTHGLGISVRWVAPEIAGGKTGLSSEADVYALGMTILEIVTGLVPYSGLRDIAVLNKIATGVHPPRPLDQMPIKNESANRIWSLLTACWKYDAKERPSATMVHEEIEKAIEAWAQTRASFHNDDGPSAGTSALNAYGVPTNGFEAKTIPIEQVMTYLANRGCHDITHHLKLPEDDGPVSIGTYGETYRATRLDGSQVQIRCYGLRVSALGANSKALKRAEREVYTWSKCRHPHVLGMVGIARFRDQVAIVSPWMENGDLAQLLSSSSSDRVDRFVMVNQVADAVAYLHDQRIVHGDIRASNVLVSKDYEAMLTGFELASPEEQSFTFTTTTGTTSTTGCLAPIQWAAPEILLGKVHRSTPSDVYSLGMTILEIITGKVPYYGINTTAVLFKVTHKLCPVRPEQDFPNSYQEADVLWSLLMSCWSYEPWSRPSAREVVGKLEDIPPREVWVKY